MTAKVNYQFDIKKIWCVIPVYNNAGTVIDVVARCLRQMENVLIVDDGSTDLNLKEACANLPVTVIRHTCNRGKGTAILTALEFIRTRDADYMITIDADGQHYPEDIPLFFPIMEVNDYSLIVGCRDFSGDNVPRSSRFGRSFANFWMKLETGIDAGDCQSGFRAYPVKYISQLKFLCSKYNFETEVLVKSAWAGMEIHTLQVRSWYPEPGKRISHFRPWVDNFRISCIHFHLLSRRMLPIPIRRLVSKSGPSLSIFPLSKFFSVLLRENATPGGLAAAAAVGTIIGIIPIPGFQSVAIVYVASRLHLNLVLPLAIQNLFMPPLAPLLCIELGYWLLNGTWLTEFTFKTLCSQMPYRIAEWWLGSLLLAPMFAVLTAGCTYLVAAFVLRKRECNTGTSLRMSDSVEHPTPNGERR
jgi:glycosyltransferase involved in cell wall biosynthesis